MLIIDNNPGFVNSVKTAFETKSYRVVTSENGAEGLMLEAEDYVSKPVEPDFLLQRVEELLRR